VPFIDLSARPELFTKIIAAYAGELQSFLPFISQAGGAGFMSLVE